MSASPAAQQKSTSPGGTQTAQGIFVTVGPDGTYAIDRTEIYAFNASVAASYYSNSWDGTISVSCAGQPAACAATPPPPPAPEPTFTHAQAVGADGFLMKQRCVLLNGQALAGSAYTQSVKSEFEVRTGTDKKGAATYAKATATYTYGYAIAPLTASAAPFAAWELVRSTGDGTLTVGIVGQIAGQSVVVSKQFPAPGKFSFSILGTDPLTGLPVSRVQNLAMSINGGAPVAISSTVVENAAGALAGAPGAVDFQYVTNAGSNGFTEYLRNGDARQVLNTDVFAGNQDGGASGGALAWAVLEPVEAELGAGDHTITLTGLVKGVSASIDSTFSINRTLSIVTPGCSIR